MSIGTLYISYDGMLEPLGQSQVLAYLEKLAVNRTIHLLSFEKAEDWANTTLRALVQARMDAAGIRWHTRRYHKRPSALATGFDMLVGTLTALWLILRYRLRLVHARSYVPAVMALVAKKLTGAKFIFDMRGFWADERVDGDLWPRDGRLYRGTKWFERRFLLNADHVISLTQSALREMQGFPYLAGRMPPVTVITTCADLARFRPLDHDKGGHLVLGYVGSAGTWYLFDSVVACFRQLLSLRPEARLLIINRNQHDYIRQRLAAGGIPMPAVEIRSARHDEVPVEMARMHAGIFFYKPSFSRTACAPTRLGEFLGCGIPCLGNQGVGDTAEILEGERVGVVIRSFDAVAIKAALLQVLALVADPDSRSRCLASAQKHFSLDHGVALYEGVYASIEKH